MQKGLDLLLTKYSVDEDAVLSESKKFVTVGTEEAFILPYESERRIIELANIVASGRIGEPCTYRIGHAAPVGTSLEDMLIREAGIIEFTLNSPIKNIFAIRGERTMNCIAEVERGTIVTIELAATLPLGSDNIDKHEIIADNGVACDRVVDTQVPQKSIYLFGEESAEYLDTDAELYGYKEIEVNTIRNAFRIAKDAEYRKYVVNKYLHLVKVLAAAKTSLDLLECVEVD